MSTINFSAREINFKIVYYGPGLSGKTTNLKQIYEQVPSESKGEMVSLATEDERTLFFDFLPLDLGKVNGSRRASTSTPFLVRSSTTPRASSSCGASTVSCSWQTPPRPGCAPTPRACATCART